MCATFTHLLKTRRSEVSIGILGDNRWAVDMRVRTLMRGVKIAVALKQPEYLLLISALILWSETENCHHLLSNPHITMATVPAPQG